jgi:hypothetical protein
MNGQRLPNGFECTTSELKALGFDSMPRGSYWIDSAGAWAVCTPNGRVGSIAKHTVVDHEDGTITVAPSILVYAIPGRTYEPAERAALVENYGLDLVEAWERGKPEWHGFLERGVWREC